MATARTILIVDDEADIREIAQVALEMVGGHSVVVATGGAECLELAAQHQPDCILLDVMMPGMDGPTTYRQLQANSVTRAIPVIMLTAKVQPAERRSLAELGVAAILAKPFDPMRLAAQVAEALGWA